VFLSYVGISPISVISVAWTFVIRAKELFVETG